MRKDVVFLLAKQVLQKALNREALLLASIILLLLGYAAITGFSNYKKETASRTHFQKQVRENWERMPDKHPHRMAHYGYYAFRTRHRLSAFDFGTESYTGNAVFLEAHRQNTVNFSEAGFSTGMLRFGEISTAMVLQVLVPLVIFFLGFSTIAVDRENGTLKILLSQGASWKELMVGKSLGLLGISCVFLIPAFVMFAGGWAAMQTPDYAGDDAIRLVYLFLAHLFYFAIVSTVTVIVSAASKTAKTALISLVGVWLLFAIILPKTTQTIGRYLYPTPSKIDFETGIERDLIKKGDSHDPNDPYFKRLKDSVLSAYKADSIQQLPFNYSGFQMKEGEKISAEIYRQHLARLLKRYEQQNNIPRTAAFVNPFAAIKNISMALCGTDFSSYTHFQQKAEDYRYRLAQHMNDLQIKLISNKKPAEDAKPFSISRDYWKAFPDFQYKRISRANAVQNEMISIAALLFWAVGLVILIHVLSKKIKAL